MQYCCVTIFHSSETRSPLTGPMEHVGWVDNQCSCSFLPSAAISTILPYRYCPFHYFRSTPGLNWCVVKRPLIPSRITRCPHYNGTGWCIRALLSQRRIQTSRLCKNTLYKEENCTSGPSTQSPAMPSVYKVRENPVGIKTLPRVGLHATFCWCTWVCMKMLAWITALFISYSFELNFNKRRTLSELSQVVFVNKQNIWGLIITKTQMDSLWETDSSLFAL